MREVTRGLQAPGRRLQVVEDAVDAIAHAQAVLGRLDVDVRGLGGDRLLDEEVDEPHDRGLEGHVAELGDVLLAVARRRPCGPCPRRSSAARWRRRTCARWPRGWPRRGATQSAMLSARVWRSSSTSSGLVGSAVATVSVEPSTGIGHAAYWRRYFGERFFSTGGVKGSSSAERNGSPRWAASARSTSSSDAAPMLDQRLAEPLAGVARARLGQRQHLRGDDAGLEQRRSEIVRRGRSRPVYRHSTTIMRAAPEGVKKPAGRSRARAGSLHRGSLWDTHGSGHQTRRANDRNSDAREEDNP